MDVYNASVYTLVFEQLMSLKRFVYHKSCGNNGDIVTLAQFYAFADLEFIIVVKYNRDGKSAEAHINRTVNFERGPYRLFSLGFIRRVYNSHTRNRAHNGYILAALVGSTVLTDGNSRVGSAYNNVKVRVAYRVSYLLVSSARRKHCKRAANYLFARSRYTCRNAYHISLGNSAIVKSFGICLFKHTCLRGGG